MLFDLPLEELQSYRPLRKEPADFDVFWKTTLEATRLFPLQADFQPIDAGMKLVDAYDVTFNGYDGQPIKGWLLLPRLADRPLPCVVEFIGYGGGRGHPWDWLFWSNAGFAHLVMDTRGQGASWRKGDTPDIAGDGATPQHPGFMTRGIYSPETYYYRRVFMDAVRAVEAAAAYPGVDANRIAVTGASQGGGIALAVAGLVPGLLAVAPDVPFLCHFRKAVQITDADPYHEIVRFCRVHRDQAEAVFKTLDYFDGVNFAPRAKCPALFSVGLMDEVCPPRTVFAAYNHYAGPKQIKIWEYNQHEGGETFQNVEKLAFVNRLLNSNS